jgi:hypothetical protein
LKVDCSNPNDSCQQHFSHKLLIIKGMDLSCCLFRPYSLLEGFHRWIRCHCSESTSEIPQVKSKGFKKTRRLLLSNFINKSGESSVYVLIFWLSKFLDQCKQPSTRYSTAVHKYQLVTITITIDTVYVTTPPTV